MKKVFALLLVLVLALGMAGSFAAAENVQTITMLIDGDMSLDAFKAVAALAEKEIGIRVEYEFRPGGAEGDNLVKTRLAAGDMADINGYNAGSLLAALNPTEYFADLSGKEWVNNLDDTFRKAVTVDGQTFGVPMFSSQAGAVLYSKPLYEKYGLSAPQTWEQFITNCKALKDAGEVAVMGTFGDSWTAQVLFLGDHYNVQTQSPEFTAEFEKGAAKYATTPAGLRSFEKYAELVGYYNEDYLAATYDDGCDAMANGEAGHWFILTQALSNIYSLYGKEAVDNVGVFGVPADDGNTGLTVWMPTAMYANKNSENLEAVLKFFEFYISKAALDTYASVQLPDGPYVVKGYQLPDTAYAPVALDMQAYFDAGKTMVAMEFETAVKGPNLPNICVEVGSGRINAEEAAKIYDDDCLKQAIQLGLNWEN